MGKVNSNENTTIEASFTSIEELCEKDTNAPHIHEMDGEYIGQFPEISVDKLMVELLLDKIQDYNRFFAIDRSNGIVHIDKSRLLKSGFEIFMY